MLTNEEIKVKDLKREYDPNFKPSQEYLNSMPDMQNAQYPANLPIQMVGIHNFKVPLKIAQEDGKTQEVQASITGTVSLEAEKRGINMSRIVRRLYSNINDTFSVYKICDVLEDYKRSLGSFDAHLKVKFPFRMWQEALRSVKEDGTKEGGWQYYDVCFDVNLDKNGVFRKVCWIHGVYSSCCVCSSELSRHAALTRGVYGAPHSQRSVAKMGIEFDDFIWIEDLIREFRKCIKTETLVFCKRSDEQGFAELNGAYPKFVEDAARILGNMLNGIPKVKDFIIILSHLESLHNHNAISVITKGLPDSKFIPDASIAEFDDLIR